MTALEARHNITQAMVWLLLLGLAAMSGLLIATNQGILVLGVGAVAWLLTLPLSKGLSQVISAVRVQVHANLNSTMFYVRRLQKLPGHLLCKGGSPIGHDLCSFMKTA